MRYQNGSAIVAVAMVALTGCAAPSPTSSPPGPQAAAAPEQPKAIDAREVEALYDTAHREDGVVLAGAHAGAHWIKWYKPDGKMELSAAHGLFADSGTYAVSGDKVCVAWNHIDDGKRTCMHLIKNGVDYITLMPDGSEGSRFRVTTQ